MNRFLSQQFDNYNIIFNLGMIELLIKHEAL